ncbi:hypothetical protein MLD38_037258 [Melastoma candidum]|uniref:Uncharacterized protein n=1 Tax=Melastoma candidum TaxID=119954 RepID=A0ACB9LMS0_9MYRT|nr:hypothetical protein MLD38_037258 [Melastoma candidum]
MEKHCTLENFRFGDFDPNACSDWSLQRSCSGEIKESDNPDVEVLENLEDYFQDLNDRLIISRMVSDSVIKGIVSAVDQEAKEKIAQKEVEISWLRSALRCYRNEDSFLDIPEACGLSRVFCHDVFDVDDFLRSSRDEVMEQLKHLRKEIDCMRGPSSFWKISTGSQLVGLGGLLSEKVSERWATVDNVINTLQSKVETVYHNLMNLDFYSKGSIKELQQERQFRGQVEASVMANCIRGYRYEFERNFWDRGSRHSGNVSTSKKIEEFRALQEELDALSKILSMNDAGKLISHGSQDVGEAFVVSDQNGKHDELVITMPENWDPAQVKHLTKDELINYFKDEMIKMKRNHETKVQQMTEEVFSLKREYYKEKGIPLTLKKEKELDALRRKIPEVMLTLKGMLTAEKCIIDSNGSSELLGLFKERLEALQSENESLRNMVSLKKEEVKYLKSQVADAAKQISFLSCAETNLLHTNRGLKSDIEETQIEASICGDVYLSFLGDLSLTLTELISGNSNRQKNDLEQSSCFGECEEVLRLAESARHWEIDHSEIESLVLHGVHEVVFMGCLKDAEEYMNYLNNELAKEVIERINLQSEGMEKEKLVRKGILENENLREDKTKLATLLVQKERLAEEAINALSSWKDQLQNAVLNINNQMSDMMSQFDQKVTSEIGTNRSRLVSLISEVGPLSQKFNMLRRVLSSYKHKLKARSSNLEKAEAEVDLLGDQVDSLLSLLEKVYIALDHYSPILKHYPGIMEILKLVRKELCGESLKSVDEDLDDTLK